MLLYLVQHGEAKREEVDPARPLTEKGRNDVAKVGKFVAGAHVRVERIFHSGKLRALQTAEILGEAFQSSLDIAEMDGLSPLDDPLIWAERLQWMIESCVITGHLPHLQRLAALLLCGTTDKKVVEFVMGGIVALERDDAGNWAISWMVRPDLLSQ